MGNFGPAVVYIFSCYVPFMHSGQTDIYYWRRTEMAKDIYAESLLRVTVIALTSDNGPIRDFPYSRPQTSGIFASVTTLGLYFKFSNTKMKESNVHSNNIPIIRSKPASGLIAPGNSKDQPVVDRWTRVLPHF